MRNVYYADGSIVAQVDDQNRIVTGHHRVTAARRLSIPMFTLDGEGKMVKAVFADDYQHQQEGGQNAL